MESRQRSSVEQFGILLDFMEKHGDLARPQGSIVGRIKAEQLWVELGALLNSVSVVKRSVDKWRKVWADWKTKTKKKASLRKSLAVPGGGPSRRPWLTASEKRILRIMGLSAMIDDEEIEEPVFEMLLLPVSSSPTSPPPGEVSVAGSNYDELTLRTSVTIKEDVMSLPGSPSPSLQTEQPAPRRHTFRQRRRHAPTSPLRAASVFAALENKRLLMEVERDRRLHERELERERMLHEREQMQHEREMTRLRVEERQAEIEHERNLIFQNLLESLQQLTHMAQQPRQ